VTLERKANEQGNLFGSVTATDIAKALQAQGFNIVQPATSTCPAVWTA
jgi:ribosomal protein L9